MSDKTPSFLKKAAELKEEYREIEEKLKDTEIVNNHEKLIELSKKKKNLEDVIKPYNKYRELESKIEEDKEIIRESEDDEIRELAEVEIQEMQDEMEKLENEIKDALVPDNPEDKKNAVMEIRAGTGGEEAALFASDLLRMYTKHSEKKGWKIELMDYNRTDMDGFKEVILLISGEGAYGDLKFESGVHRVQRVPKTESGGRIHTSAVTVAVLPEREEVEIEINPDDIEIDFYSASGPGGQHVNRASSAVRLEHKPSGIVVACQDERSQHQNREKAMKLLRTRLYEYKKKKEEDKRRSKRKELIGTGDRSEKIRTYNFPQNRITDHRINYTKYNLQDYLDGNLEDLIKQLKEEQRQRITDEIE